MPEAALEAAFSLAPLDFMGRKYVQFMHTF